MQKRYTTVERAESIVRKAVLGGYGFSIPYADDPLGLVARRRIRLECSMDCESPYTFEIWSRESAVHGKKVLPIGIEIVTRCRKCQNCRERRSMFWAGRAIEEINKAQRTYMGSFTMSPAEHELLDMRVAKRLLAGGTNFYSLSPSEKFVEQTKEFGFELTKWFKRIRKGRSSNFRYLLVAERHDSDETSIEMKGRPHFHILIHESSAEALVHGSPTLALDLMRDGELEMRKVKGKNGTYTHAVYVTDDAFIRKQWAFGFTKFRYCFDARSAYYVCKYLTSEMGARVRASYKYGKDLSGAPRSEGQRERDPLDLKNESFS